MTPIDPQDAEAIALFAAIADSADAQVAALLSRRPELANARDADGQTPLHAAAWFNNPHIGALLVAAGADGNANYGQSGHTPLSWAVTCRSLDFANALIRLGVDADLFCAAGVGSVELVNRWFDHDGALRPGAARTGSSRKAADGSRLPVPPATPRAQISDALYIASRNAHVDVVRLLLAKDPDLSFRAYAGGTALHWAHFGGSPEAIDLLLAAGADDMLRDDVLKVRPRAFGICTPASWGFADLVRRHLVRDPSLATVLDGTSALHEAARGGSLEIVRMLLDAGASPASPDRDGRTAVDLASERGHQAVVEALTQG